MSHDHHAHAGHNMHSSVNGTTPSPLVTTPLQAILTTVLAAATVGPPHSHHGAHVSSSQTVDHATMDMGHGDSGGHGLHMDMGGMKMYFHVGVTETILFKEWSVSTVGGMLGSVVGVFFMAAMYEGLKYFREHLFRLHFSSINYSSVAVTGQDGRTITEVHQIVRNRIVSWAHIIQTLLHMLQMVISYFLMLIFMTYNVWLCLAVVLGAGFGYFIFGWKKATVVDVTDHCH